MTKVGQIIQEEIDAAVAAATAEAAEAVATAKAEKNSMAKIMLRDGMEPSAVVRYTGLTNDDIERLLLS
jgi:hypothetical protein